MNQPALALPDKHQTAWQLASIQLSGWISLPILTTSILILQGNSFLGAVLTIIVGNAILWFIRLGIISMSFEKRQSTLDISREYLGEARKYFIAVLLLVSTLAWFIAQTQTGSSAITHLLSIKESPDIDQFTQVSIFLGIVSTLFCMGGIILLRRLATFSFPILVVVFFVILYLLPGRGSLDNGQPLSFYGLGLVLSTSLGITSDMPTFFRHSRSWSTSVIALTIIQVISLVLGLASLYLGSIVSGAFEINEGVVNASGGEILRFGLIVFIFLSVISANVANVYSASVGWELVAPKALVGRKEFFILGLGLTTIFILVSGLFSLEYLLNVTDSSLVNLCIVLVVGYGIAVATRKGPNLFDQKGYFLAWLLSTLVNLMQFSHFILARGSPLLTALGVICTVILASRLIKRFI